MNIKIFTDGSCTNNGRKDSYGSYAFLILSNNQHFHEYSEFTVDTTNNKMELMAMLKSLQYIKECCYQYINSITIYSDSKYAIQRAGQFLEDTKFPKEVLKIMPNVELLKEFSNLKFSSKVKFEWVKGHSKQTDELTEYNNYVDNLCSQEVIKNGGIPYEESDLFVINQNKKESKKKNRNKVRYYSANTLSSIINN